MLFLEFLTLKTLESSNLFDWSEDCFRKFFDLKIAEECTLAADFDAVFGKKFWCWKPYEDVESLLRRFERRNQEKISDLRRRMGSKWRKAKIALGLNLCVYVPGSHDDASPSVMDAAARFSDASSISPTVDRDLDSTTPKTPTTPTPSSSGLRLPKSGSRSSKVWDSCNARNLSSFWFLKWILCWDLLLDVFPQDF